MSDTKAGATSDALAESDKEHARRSPGHKRDYIIGECRVFFSLLVSAPNCSPIPGI